MTLSKAYSSGVTCITRCWQNAMNSPIYQVPTHSAFSSSRMWLSSFSSGSKQWPQLITGVEVCSLSRYCCKSKVARPQLDTLVSIYSSAERSALIQHGTVMMHHATSRTYYPAAAIYGWASWPKSWCSGSTNLVKAGIYSL